MPDNLPLLQRSMNRREVGLLQQLLNAENLKYETLGIDNDFGTSTYNAVREFQRREGLSVDGSVGSLSWKALIDNDASRGIYDVWKGEAAYPSSGKNWKPTVSRVISNYLEAVKRNAERLAFDAAGGIGILSVESGGSGVTELNGKTVPLIRFEVHIFKRRAENATSFNQLFRIKPGYEKEPWLSDAQQMRTSPSSEWVTIHKPASQAKEHQALELAKSINVEGAYKSISIGVGQIMGFHYARFRYPTAEAMFEAFHDEDVQIDGFFSFIENGTPEQDNGADMLTALRTKDWYGFALGYNGPGQPDIYGPYINDAYHEAKDQGVV